MPKTYRSDSETLNLDFEDRGINTDKITLEDLIALGAKPVQAWRIGKTELFVVETSKGTLQDVAFGR